MVPDFRKNINKKSTTKNKHQLKKEQVLTSNIILLRKHVNKLQLGISAYLQAMMPSQI